MAKLLELGMAGKVLQFYSYPNFVLEKGQDTQLFHETCLEVAIQAGPSVEEKLIQLLSQTIRAKIRILRNLGMNSQALQSQLDSFKPEFAALVKIGNAKCIEVLISLLEHDNKQLRESAINSLIQIGAPSVDALIESLTKENCLRRQCAAIALGRLGDACAIEPLVKLMKDKDPSVREAVATSLSALGWQPNEKSDDRSSLKKNLRKVQIGMEVDALVALIGSPNFSMPQSAAFTMFGMPEESLPDDVRYSENWVYKTELGEFQVVVKEKRITQITGLDTLLRKQ